MREAPQENRIASSLAHLVSGVASLLLTVLCLACALVPVFAGTLTQGVTRPRLLIQCLC